MGIASGISQQLVTRATGRAGHQAARTAERQAGQAVAPRMAADGFSRTTMAEGAGAALRRADRRLDAVTAAQARQVAPTAAAQLRQADQAFRLYRDQHAALVAHVEAGGGTGASLSRAQAALNLTEERLAVVVGAPSAVPSFPVQATTTVGMATELADRATALRARNQRQLQLLAGKLDAEGGRLAAAGEAAWSRYEADAVRVTAEAAGEGTVGRIAVAAARQRLAVERAARIAEVFAAARR